MIHCYLIDIKNRMRYIILLLLLSSCIADPHSPSIESPGTITLIFEAHSDYKTNLPDGIAQYMDDHFIQQILRPNQQGDTLTIQTTRDHLGLGHTFLYQEKEGGPTTYSQLHFTFQNGDTVRFSYDGFRPNAQVLNREVLPYDVNYTLAAWEQLYERKTPVRNYMFEFLFNPEWTEEEREENFFRYLDQIHAQDVEEVEREDAFLDSLFNEELMSEQAYAYQKAINYFRVMEEEERRFRVDQYINQRVVDGEGVQPAGLVPRMSYEELAAVGSIQYVLNDYIAHRFQIPTVTKTYDGSGGKYPDYPVKFDSTLGATWLPQKVKEMLLLDDLKGIIEEYPVDVRFRYLSAFKEFATDTAMVNYITTQYSLDAGEEEEIILEDPEGQTSTFSELIAAHVGKVVYIDWWAGWCAPCVRVMPEMRALEERMVEEDVAILYISIEEYQDGWLTSTRDLLPDANRTSYRVANKYVSHQLEAFNIQFVPRYFLIDQEGEIVEAYAPGPEDERLYKLIADLLNTESNS